jgi:hypothetical protein
MDEPFLRDATHLCEMTQLLIILGVISLILAICSSLWQGCRSVENDAVKDVPRECEAPNRV